MKNITKRFFFYLLLLSQLILNAKPVDPCPLAILVTDLSTSGAEFKIIVKDSDGFNAWLVLNKEAPALRTNLDELRLVSKNLDEISKVGGYSKWKTIQKTENVIVKGDYLSHEYNQIIKLGEELGGGTAQFNKAQQGIEGIFTKLNGEKIPFSLKQVTPDLNSGNGVKNIFREIKDNASKIRDGYTNNDALIKQYCQIGNNPNTYIRVDVTNMNKVEILQYYNSIEESRRILLFGGEGVFKQIKIIDKNGETLVFNNYNLVK